MSVKYHLAVCHGNLPRFWIFYGTPAYAYVVCFVKLCIKVSIGRYTYRHYYEFIILFFKGFANILFYLTCND